MWVQRDVRRVGHTFGPGNAIGTPIRQCRYLAWGAGATGEAGRSTIRVTAAENTEGRRRRQEPTPLADPGSAHDSLTLCGPQP